MQTFQIKDLQMDKDIYPRNIVDFKLIGSYSYAMETGAKFPPIKVEQRGNTQYVIDGWHRTRAAHNIGKKTIEGELVAFSKENRLRDALIMSIETNTTHGKALCFHEKLRAMDELKKLKVPQAQISRILSIPPNTFNRLLSGKIAYNANKEPVPLKQAFLHLSGQTISKKAESLQKQFCSLSQARIIDSLTILIREQLLDMNDDKVVKKLTWLKKIMYMA